MSAAAPSWRPRFSPRYRWAQVPAAQVQEALRCRFERRGRPGVLRVDNGIPWAIPGGLPSGLSLWAAGLDIGMHWNDPYRPQQNGVVESTQGTSRRWAEPENCRDLEQLCRALEREDRIQREEYPSIGGRSRREAYPGLLHSGRGYSRGCEEQVWDLGAALRLLARYRVRRKVSRRGQVSLYHRPVQVGAEHGGSRVDVQLDPQTAEWVVYDVGGKELRRRPAAQFTAQALRELAVGCP